MVLGSRIPIIAIDDDDDDEDDLMHKKIFVKVTGLEGENDTFFKIEIHLPLQWVMVKYCDIKKLDYECTRFEFNGSRLRHMDTPYLLGMVHNDSIYASPATESGVNGNNAVQYVALCIRMHKERGIFHRVRRCAALLPQLVQYFPDVALQDCSYISFVYNGLRISQNHTADNLNMEDGDVIDGFNFGTMSSSLSITNPRFNLTIINLLGKKRHFSVSPGTYFGTLMDKYSQLTGIPIDQLWFIRHGKQLSVEETVEDVHLKDGDTVLVLSQLRGS
ncbi:unnamed protein product [Amaranthus hypochondriacus]